MQIHKPILAGLLFAVCASRALAADFCVTNSAGLAAALDAADNNGQSDTLRIAQGVYAGSFLYNANAGETGDLSLLGGYDAACVTRDPDPAGTVIDGGGARAMRISGRDNSALLVESLTVRNGGAQLGGAGLDIDRFVQASLRDNVFTNNHNTPGFDGAGGAALDRTVSIVVERNRFTGNTGGKGGGLQLSDFAQASVLANDFIDNEAEQGGAGIDADTSGRLVLVNNVVARNRSDEDAGGINVKLFEDAGAGELIFTNNTVTANTAAQEGGGMDLKMTGDATSALIYNNIVYANAAPQGGRDLFLDNDDERNGVAAPITLENNDFDQAPGGLFVALPFAVDPSNLNNVNPQFLDLVADDYRLSPSSVLIDAGTAAAAELPAGDRAGLPRVSGGAPDIGAFEFQAEDTDGDGIADATDNCTLIANSDQRDTDGDGFGNICDPDLNQDNQVNFLDLALFKAVFFETGDLDADFNGDGVVNFIDLGIIKSFFFGPPGPGAGAP